MENKFYLRLIKANEVLYETDKNKGEKVVYLEPINPKQCAIDLVNAINTSNIPYIKAKLVSNGE